MNNKIIIWLLIIILVILVGSVWFLQKKHIFDHDELVKVFKEGQGVEKIDTTNWEVYRNDFYGYQIKYPKDWDVYVKDYDKLSFPELIKKRILDFLSKFIIISPDYPRASLSVVELYIAKDCDLQALKERNAQCANGIKISTHKPVAMPCAKDKSVSGQLPISISEAFYNIFSLNEGEERESLKYSNGSSCFIYDDIPRCVYKFINDAIYYDDESCYSIDIKDSSKERRNLRMEEAILDSLRVFKKTE